jgi:hypothetical protein
MLMATEQRSTIPSRRSTPLRFAEHLVAPVLFGLIIVLAQALAIEDGKVRVAEKRRSTTT